MSDPQQLREKIARAMFEDVGGEQGVFDSVEWVQEHYLQRADALLPLVSAELAAQQEVTASWMRQYKASNDSAGEFLQLVADSYGVSTAEITDDFLKTRPAYRPYLTNPNEGEKP